MSEIDKHFGEAFESIDNAGNYAEKVLENALQFEGLYESFVQDVDEILTFLSKSARAKSIEFIELAVESVCTSLTALLLLGLFKFVHYILIHLYGYEEAHPLVYVFQTIETLSISLIFVYLFFVLTSELGKKIIIKYRLANVSIKDAVNGKQAEGDS